jgi:hypothetical protein
MPTLYALDLTALPGSDPLWRALRGSASSLRRAEKPRDLPGDGFASPLGYWFTDAASWTMGGSPLRVEVVDSREMDGASHAIGDGQPPTDAAAGHRTRVRLELAAGGAPLTGSSSGACPLIIEIDARTARVGVNTETWPSVREPVLLVIAQYWRFRAVDHVLDDLSDWARAGLQDRGFLGPIRPRHTRPLRACRRAFQELLLDLPDFEGLLTNPRRYLASGRPLRLYRALAVRLALYRQRCLIDERVEVVEAVLDSLVESLHHYQALASQIVLELVIVAVLLVDVGLYFLG